MNSTLGFSPHAKPTSLWYTSQGKSEFLRLIKNRIEQLAPGEYVEVYWNDEMQDVFVKIPIDPYAPLQPTPFFIDEAVSSLVDRYIQRSQRRAFLEKTRVRTSVALTPRAETSRNDDKSENGKLLHPSLQSNEKYAEFLSLFQD